MASNDNLVFARYSNKSEDRRAYISRAYGLEFHFTKELLEKYLFADGCNL